MENGVLGECSLHVPKHVVEGQGHVIDCAILQLHHTVEIIVLEAELVLKNVTHSPAKVEYS